MGYTTCGRHAGTRCCWRCDRCPKCEPNTGRLGKGDYCADCRKKCEAEGYVWSDYYGNYVKPEDVIEIHAKQTREEGTTRIPRTDLERAKRAYVMRLNRAVDNLFTTEGR